MDDAGYVNQSELAMTFGIFFTKVVVELSISHQWHEHANALLYSQGAPELIDYALTLWEDGQGIDLAARLINEKFNEIHD